MLKQETPLRQQPQLSKYGPKRHKRPSPLILIGISVPVVILLVAAVVIVVLPRLRTHAAAVNGDCTLIVPPDPLTAQGLATPYQLVATNQAAGACNEANAGQAAFVQGAVIDPATGVISIYNPLVIDQGTQPAAQPVVPTLPANGIVALWFGFNGNNLTLQTTNNSLNQGRCVNGVNNSIFGQFAYCNAPAFFRAANAAIRAGQLKVPALGTAKDGQPCPTVRDFSVVDMDQSDNVTSTYLVAGNNTTAQVTAANIAALQGTQTQVNGSDNRLLAVALDGALGCTPWTAPDLADKGNMVPALPLNELQAAAQQAAPVALVPAGDPMVLNNGKQDLNKVNAYRRGVDQMPARTAANNGQPGDAGTTMYCQNMLNTAPARLQLDMTLTQNRPSPDPAAASTLFTFLANRFNTAFGANGLNCAGLLNKPNPITLTTDANGVVTAATITVPNGNANGGNGNGNGGNGNGGNGNGNGQNAVNCVVNGTTIQGCNGTVTLNGQTCTLALNATTNQVDITCPANPANPAGQPQTPAQGQQQNQPQTSAQAPQ
jgi:hypothetical protein